MVRTAATTSVLPSKVVDMGRRASTAFWSASNISFFLGCFRLVAVVASVMGGRTEADVNTLEREVSASTN